MDDILKHDEASGVLYGKEIEIFINHFCKDGLCEASDFFEMIEVCGICGKIL